MGGYAERDAYPQLGSARRRQHRVDLLDPRFCLQSFRDGQSQFDIILGHIVRFETITEQHVYDAALIVSLVRQFLAALIEGHLGAGTSLGQVGTDSTPSPSDASN